jgi:hypothetical protein
MKTLSLLLLTFGCVLRAANPPGEDVYAELAVPEKRLAAQQVIFDYALTFRRSSDESKAWFKRLAEVQAALEDPEAKAALAQTLALDPAVRPVLPIGKKIPVNYPTPEGSTPETKLAETERWLDLGRPNTENPLSVEELTVLAKSEDFALAQRAHRLLRRINAAVAAPLYWERLGKLSQRSQVQAVEEEILRLPVSLAIKFLPSEPVGEALAVKAAWVRIVGVRASRYGRSGATIKAAILPLLKGPANELTEAAWEALPRLFTEADRAVLTEASVGLSERLAPKAKAALAALPAK